MPLAVFVTLFVALLLQDRPRLDLRGHRGHIGAVAFQPDGAQLATFSSEGMVKLWDLSTGQPTRELGPRGRGGGNQFAAAAAPHIEGIAFFPTGAAGLAEVADDGGIRIWNPDDGTLLRTLAEGARGARAVAVSPDGKLVASNQTDGQRLGHLIVLRDATSGAMIAELRSDRLAATHLAFSPDGVMLASAGAKKLNIWSVAARKLTHEIVAHDQAIQGVVFSADSKRLVSGSGDDRVKIWDSGTGKLLREIEAGQDGVHSVAISPSGKTIASGGSDKRVRLWDPETGKRFRTLWGHTDKVTSVAFSQDGKLLASGSRDSTVAVWDFSEPETPTYEKVDDEEKDKKKKK